MHILQQPIKLLEYQPLVDIYTIFSKILLYTIFSQILLFLAGTYYFPHQYSTLLLLTSYTFTYQLTCHYGILTSSARFSVPFVSIWAGHPFYCFLLGHVLSFSQIWKLPCIQQILFSAISFPKINVYKRVAISKYLTIFSLPNTISSRGLYPQNTVAAASLFCQRQQFPRLNLFLNAISSTKLPHNHQKFLMRPIIFIVR